jgi:hypothetical protein
VATPDAVRAALQHISRLADEVGPPFRRPAMILGDGAMVGPAAAALDRGMTERHRAVERCFADAFYQVSQLAPVPGAAPPRKSAPPSAGRVSGGEERSGDPDKLEALARELRRTGRELDYAGRTLGSITSRVGLGAFQGRPIGEAGGWADTQAADVRRRREELLHFDDGVADALEGALGIVTAAVAGTLGTDQQSRLLARARAGDQTALAQLLGMQRSNPDPQMAARVAAWWTTLTPTERQRLLETAPAQMGALDGLPSTVRDQANRSHLASEKTRLLQRIADVKSEARMPNPEPEEGPMADPYDPQPMLGNDLDDLTTKLRSIEALERQLADPPPDGGPRRFLLGFDLRGSGHTIVSVGDPDEADNVVTYVPGFGTTLSNTAGNVGNRATNLWGQTTQFAPDKKTASIYWLGYDAPLGGDVGGTRSAQAGAPMLQSFESGLHAAHQAIPAHWTMLGHSYGSLVVGITAKNASASFADDIVFIGSPGVGVDHAKDLGLSPDHVWSGRSKLDPVPDLPPVNPMRWPDSHSGRFGNDPTSPEFGGHPFEVQDGDPADALHDHSIYWDRNSISLRNMAHVVNGQYGQVTWTESTPNPQPQPSPVPRTSGG